MIFFLTPSSAELGVMAKKSSAEVKELDIINDSLLSKIEQMKLEIDDATAKLHEACTVIKKKKIIIIFFLIFRSRLIIHQI